MGIGYVDSWVGMVMTTPDATCQKTHSDVVEWSLSSEEKANTLDNGTTLYSALAQGNLNIVRSLLSSGANSNERNVDNWTPLAVASRKERLEVAKLLVRHDADVKSPGRDKAGWSPLHTASRHGRLDVARLLIDHGADVD